MRRSLNAALHARAATHVDPAAGPQRARRRVAALRDTLGVDLGAGPGGQLGDQPRVVVVGGGFAGLSAALILRMYGCQVALYEATARLGGRVWSQPAANARERLVEWGAELIGFNHAMWLWLAEAFELGFAMQTGEDAWDRLGLTLPVDLLGQVVPDGDDVWTAMDAAFQTLNDATTLVPDPYAPWAAPNAAALDAQSLSQWKARLQLPPRVDAAVEVDFACNNTRPTALQSYLGVLAQVSGGGGAAFWTDTEVMRCATGNQSLAAAMSRWLVDRGVVLSVGTPVVGVSWNGSTMATRLAGGSTVTSDYVVLATPQPVWSSITFSPALPSGLQVQTGPAVKFLTTLDRRVWLRSRLAPMALSDVVGETWEGTDNQTMQAGEHAVLSVFAGAHQAEAALSRGPDPSAWYADRLKLLYPGYVESRAGTSFLAWPNQPFVGCGYSCPAPNQVTTAVQALSRPAATLGGRLVFAGEHVSPCFFGYMEGALESGLHAAEVILGGAGLRPADSVDAALRAAAQAGRAT